MAIGIYETGRKNGWYWLGRKHIEESKKKMSKKAKGRIISEETRKKWSETRKGKPSNHQVEKIEWNCQNCGKIKYLSPCFAKKRKYCSHKCQIPWNKGQPYYRLRGENHPLWNVGKR